MSVIKQLTNVKFSPADTEVEWTHVETLVHGPGAGEDNRSINSAVFACLMAIASAYPEPPLTVFRQMAPGKREALPDHPLQTLIDKPTPNGELSTEEILFWMAWAKHLDGNAYLVKTRSGNEVTGNVVQLWPVSPSRMKPVADKPAPGQPPDWISYYKYRQSPTRTLAIPVENVMHFRLGLDDRDMKKGLSPFKALVRQVATDEEADKFIAELLQNYAVPGLVVNPTNGDSVDPEKAEIISEKLRRKFGTGKRGNIAVMSKETKIEQFGFSPKDLDMTVLHRIPEERISAVFGVPAIIAGLGAGLERATYNNAREMGEWFTERKLIPQWRSDAAKFNTSLTPDFSSDPDVLLDYDLTNVRALQEDMTALFTRLYQATGNKAFITRNEARTQVGMDPVDGWDEADTSPPQIPPQLQNAQQQDQNPNDQQAADEIRAWRLWAVKIMDREGKIKPTDEFKPVHTPLGLSGAISGALQSAKTVADVKQIFEDVWMGYP